MELEPNAALTLLVQMAAQNLIVTRKLIDTILVTTLDPNQALAAGVVLRKETAVATQELVREIYENYGNVDFDDLFGLSKE